VIWKAIQRGRNRRRHTDGVKRRSRGPERLEARRMLAADPIQVGVVYLETDYLETDQDVGSDSQGDRFILSFTGGAPDTQLGELRIRTDKDGDGISVGDPIFDTALGGRGKNGAHGFQVVRVRTADGHQIDASADVEDGGQELVLRLSNFYAGDRLEFTLDVDEVLRQAVDLDLFNDRLDVITSGQEFQDSILEATFHAPHYEPSQADAVFLNDYGDPTQTRGLDLPPDEGSDIDSRPNRSAAAVASTMQSPAPIEISGHVWIDSNLDTQRAAGEQMVAGVEISIWQQAEDGSYVDTLHRATTDADGMYLFSKSLGLLPGQYRVVQSRPDGFFSVGAVPGTVEGIEIGISETPNSLIGIRLPLGDTAALNYDFAVAQPASLSGFVYRDDSQDGHRDPGEPGVAGVRIRVVPIDTIAPQSSVTATTAEDGSYAMTGLAPGRYEVIEVDQPPNLNDGIDSVGTISGQQVGSAHNPGDRISQIVLAGSDAGVEYNFGETSFGAISGYVYLASPGQDCSGDHDTADSTPLSGVEIELQTEDGVTVSRTTTGGDGGYTFDGVPIGVYRIVEFTPNGLINGSAHNGRLDDLPSGVALDGGSIQSITMTPAGVGVEYNFCEAAPASISGYVYQDQSNDGVRDAGESAISGVQVDLVDADGQLVATAQTDVDGRYNFVDVAPGEYTIVESQPADFFDGLDSIGNIRGQTTGQIAADDALRVSLRQGDIGQEYNFGELAAASLFGIVHVDLDGDCWFDSTELGIEGVQVELYDDSGELIATATTDSSGTYRFTNLTAGSYTVREVQPGEWIHRGQRAGSGGGDAGVADEISSISVGWGEQLTDYNFCELEPASVSGVLFVDGNGDCDSHASQQVLPGVTIELRDKGGRLIASTTTDANGQYRFDHLEPGEYEIFEQSDDGFLHGGQGSGTGNGQVLGDHLLGVELLAGDQLTGYRFCKLKPASISGKVWQESDPNQQFEPGDRPLPGVLLELIDDSGQSIAQESSDASGNYTFEKLLPGSYSVRQAQPDGFFHGGQIVGDAGGLADGDDLIVGIELLGGTDASGYDFPEVPPAMLSGFVFQDGAAMSLAEIPDPERLREFRDGRLTPDDRPLAGIKLELRNVLGLPIDSGRALPGVYANGPIHATTDANGFYEFKGLRPGTYHVYQVQPASFVDGLDTPGTAGGVAVNAADENTSSDRITIQTLTVSELTDPGHDAILNIMLVGGGQSLNNNFSEIAIAEAQIQQIDIQVVAIPALEIPFALTPVLQTPVPPTVLDTRSFILSIPTTPSHRDFMTFEHVSEVSWHLSVINGGFPRGKSPGKPIIRGVSVKDVGETWHESDRASGRWTIASRTGLPSESSGRIVLGDVDAAAVAGDFDGNGVDEAAIYVGGQWFVDLNGNGRWDNGDLWIRLGTALDIPVVGDWDGDGKDDIGIFGLQWQRDSQRIRQEPGLPDPDNKRRREFGDREQASRQNDQGQHHKRLLRRGNQGSLRADAVDHVFQYGEEVDIPIAGDWNGDGIDQIAVFRGGTWMLDVDGDGRWTNDDQLARFGRVGDEPIVGDFNGDEIDEIGVVRGDVWIIDSDGDRRITGNDLRIVVPREDSNSQPIVGDFDHDGKDEPGYYDEAA
jgi:serine-aspartate repeat-containing protein C/D/E